MTLLDAMARRGYTVERLAGAIGIAPEVLNRKIEENSFTIGDAQKIIQALNLSADKQTVFIVQRCLVTSDVPVKQLAGVYATLDGAVDALERDAAAAGAEFVCDPGEDAWQAWIGRERYVIEKAHVQR